MFSPFQYDLETCVEFITEKGKIIYDLYELNAEKILGEEIA